MQGSVIITAILRSRHTWLGKEGIIVLELGREIHVSFSGPKYLPSATAS